MPNEYGTWGLTAFATDGGDLMVCELNSDNLGQYRFEGRWETMHAPRAGNHRIFVDTRDWDNTLGMNTPGRVADPGSPLYDNLFESWANDRVLPAFYSRDKIESVLFEKLQLNPAEPGL